MNQSLPRSAFFLPTPTAENSGVDFLGLRQAPACNEQRNRLHSTVRALELDLLEVSRSERENG
jgi:hypothetical protein